MGQLCAALDVLGILSIVLPLEYPVTSSFFASHLLTRWLRPDARYNSMDAYVYTYLRVLSGWTAYCRELTC